MTADQLERLRETYRREGLGLLQYARQTTPFAKRADRPVVTRMLQMGEDEGKILEKMADQLLAGRTNAPMLGGFPSSFTNFNYFDVWKLLPLLIADSERLIGCLREEVSAGIPGLASELLAVKEAHLAEMKALAPGSQSAKVTGSAA